VFAISQYRYHLGPRAILGVLLVAAVALPRAARSQAGAAGVIGAEPEFTAGTFNVIEFDTAALSGADVYEACFFDAADPAVHACIELAPSQSLGASAVNAVFEDLDDGHTYHYYVQAHFVGADSAAYSDTTSSTQDASPPQMVSDAVVRGEPGGKVILDWTGVNDAVSSVTGYYIYRRLAGQSFSLVDSVTPGAAGAPHTYRDSLAGSSGLVEAELQWFQVRTVDLVGNGINSDPAGPVAPDATAPRIPTLTLENAYYDVDSTAYTAGVRTRVTARTNGAGPEAADSIRFEWARDSVSYFNSQWQPGWEYGSTNWLVYRPDSLFWNVSLLPPNGDTDFVHNHFYWFRARAKDTSGNISDWSEPIGTFMDAYPPSDIANLTAEPKPDSLGVACIMVVQWEAATDAGSGVGKYYVYRSQDSLFYKRIDSVAGGVTVYEDSCRGLDDRRKVWYKIASRDNAGNLRGYSQDWVAGGRPPMPPVITAVCDTSVDGQCFVKQAVFVHWSGYDNSMVTRYLVDYNGYQIELNDPNTFSITIPLPWDTVWTIRVRSFFNDGNVSVWSAAQHVRRDNSAPQPVVDLEVVADSIGYSGDIYLNWSKPWDSAAASDVVQYNLYRMKPGDTGWVRFDSTLTNDSTYPNDGAIYTDYYADPYDDTLVAFQWYRYVVRPVDLLGNENRNDPSIDSAYCRRPPTIVDDETGGDSIYIRWERADPNKVNSWYAGVRVYKNSFATLFRDTVVFRTPYPLGFTVYLSPADSGNYIFQVREIPLSDTCCVGMASAYSAPWVVPFDNRPPKPDSLFVQPQPSFFGGSPSIHVAWYYDDPELVDSFTVIRRRQGFTDVLLSAAASGNHYDSLMDAPVAAEVLYQYGVYTHDTLGQTSDTIWGAGRIRPMWMFTPELPSPVPAWFNSDTLHLAWRWLDESYSPVDSNYGAKQCQLQISIDSGFQAAIPHIDGAWVQAGLLGVDVTGVRSLAGLLGGGEARLYGRIRARDRWGHVSPWSTEYFPPATMLLDSRPPSICTTLVIDSTRAHESSSDRAINVYLNWEASADRGGSGMKSYNVYRLNPDASTTLLQTLDYTVTAYRDDNVDVRGVDNCEYNYRVQAVDSIGNEQAIGNRVVCLNVLSAPTIDSVTSHKICWTNNDPVAADAFYAEIALDPAWLGTELVDSLGHAELISGDSTCFTFATNFDAGAGVYYHIKAIRDQLESGWSDIDSFVPIPTDVDDGQDGGELPRSFALYPNYPNPFNPVTHIAFDLPRHSHVLLRVFNIKGELVQTLHRGPLAPGRHVISWHGLNGTGEVVASGVYIYQIQADETLISRKMVLLR